MEQFLKSTIEGFLQTQDIPVTHMPHQELIYATHTCNLLAVGNQSEFIARIHFFPSDQIKLLKMKQSHIKHMGDSHQSDLINELLNVVVGKIRTSLREKGIDTLQGLPYITPGVQEIFNQVSNSNYNRLFYVVKLKGFDLIFELSIMGIDPQLFNQLEETKSVDVIEYL